MTTTKTTPFFNPDQKEWDSAKITSGTYNTKAFYSKKYSSKSGLSKGLKAHGYKSTQPYNGETWNYGGKQYKVNFDFN